MKSVLAILANDGYQGAAILFGLDEPPEPDALDFFLSDSGRSYLLEERDGKD